MPKKIVGRFCERALGKKSAFDRKSIRWKKSGKSWVLVGCPKGKFKAGKCHVGMRALKLLAATKGKRCCPRARAGERCVVKG